MADNLMGFASTNGPYLHSKAFNFRREVGTSLRNETYKASDDIKQTLLALERLKAPLESAAKSFLVDWNGDYRKASKELFLGGENKENSTSRFRKIAKEILNSHAFVNIIQKNSRVDFASTIGPAMQKYNKKELEEIINTSTSVEEFVDRIMKKFFRRGKADGRVDLTGDNRAFVRDLLGDMARSYTKNKQNLRKQLEKQLQKKARVLDVEAIYIEFRKGFMKKVKDEEYIAADNFLLSIESEFKKRLRKIDTLDQSNISGEIVENLEISVISDNKLGLIFYDVGDKTEDQLLTQVREIANSLMIDGGQIKKNLKTENAVKSGTDWIIVNSHGQMVRAQVKNSMQLVEEMQMEGSKLFPQTVKIQDQIYYKTLKENIQTYNKDTPLTASDWANLEYLIANVLWIRAGKRVSIDKGADYKSGVSGIMEIINRIFAKEIGYFLGAGLDSIYGSTQVIIGQSNLFFVLDGLILFPTYLIIENVMKQLQEMYGALGRIQVTLGNSFSQVKAKAMEDSKTEAKKENLGWSYGDPYGAAVLAAGREAGTDIIDTLQLSRINVNINIDQILAECFNKSIII